MPDSEAFDRESGGYLDLIDDLIVTGMPSLEENSPLIPSADSPAMAALARQSGLGGPWYEMPVDDLNSQLALTLSAAQESMAAFVTLLRSPRPPAYAHYPNVRMALEALGVVHHLALPALALEKRIARFINLMLNDYENRLEYLPANAQAKQQWKARAAELTSACKTLGESSITPKKGRNVQYIGARPPGPIRLVEDVLGSRELGRTAYFLTSGKAHASLINGLLPGAEKIEDLGAGIELVGIPVRAVDVATCACLMAIAHRNAYGAYCSWVGRPPGDRRAEAERRTSGLLDAWLRSLRSDHGLR